MAAAAIVSLTTSQISASAGDSTETFLPNTSSPLISVRHLQGIRCSSATHLTVAAISLCGNFVAGLKSADHAAKRFNLQSEAFQSPGFCCLPGSDVLPPPQCQGGVTLPHD